MKKLLKRITASQPASNILDISLFLFRVLLSIELMMAHGLKKIGIGVAEPEQIPNPLHFPQEFNDLFAIAANLIFPIFVILGLFTRLSVLPSLAVTLTGYFLLHWNDALLIKDGPFMYSLCYLLLLVLGPGRFSLDYFINKKLQ